MNKEKKAILDEVILGYRKLIHQRYQYDRILETYEIPDSFDEERVNIFREYFLDNIYPHPEKRDELDDAFKSLNGYIKQPEKLIRIIIDSSSLIFKYGRHLPKIMRAGIKAMKSFQEATEFEDKLVAQALLSDIRPPFSEADMNTFIQELSLDDIQTFIVNNETLFETLHDRKLVAKIKEIVDFLIQKMKKRPKTYAPSEIKGLEIGRDIIVQGDALFDQLEKEEQEKIFDFVLAMEREHLEVLFGDEE